MKRFLAVLALAVLVDAPSAAGWTWPVEGPIVRPFVFGGDPYAAGQHRGIDIGAPVGTTVVAAAAGKVSFAGSVPSAGRAVTVQTADGFSVTYLELGATQVARGAEVAEGDAVGTIGAAAHLHFGIRVTADPHGYLDPLAFLPADTKAPAVSDPAQAPAPVEALPGPEPGPAPADVVLADVDAASPVTAVPVSAPVAEPEPEPEPEPAREQPVVDRADVVEPAVVAEAAAEPPAAVEAAAVAAERVAALAVAEPEAVPPLLPEPKPEPVPVPEPNPVPEPVPEPVPVVERPAAAEPDAHGVPAEPTAAITPMEIGVEADSPAPVSDYEAVPEPEPAPVIEAVPGSSAAEATPESVSDFVADSAAAGSVDVAESEPVSVDPGFEPPMAGAIAGSDRVDAADSSAAVTERAASVALGPVAQAGTAPTVAGEAEEQSDEVRPEPGPAELVPSPRLEAGAESEAHPAAAGGAIRPAEEAASAPSRAHDAPELDGRSAAQPTPASVFEAARPRTAPRSAEGPRPPRMATIQAALVSPDETEEPAPRRVSSDEPVRRPAVVPAPTGRSPRADGRSAGVGTEVLLGVLALTLGSAAIAVRRRRRPRTLRPTSVQPGRCPLGRSRCPTPIHACTRASEPTWLVPPTRPRRVPVPLRPLPRPRRRVLAAQG